MTNIPRFRLNNGIEMPAIGLDALETGVRGGPDPDAITLETFSRVIPEA